MAKAGHWSNSEKAVRLLLMRKSGYLLDPADLSASASTEGRLLLRRNPLVFPWLARSFGAAVSPCTADCPPKAAFCGIYKGEDASPLFLCQNPPRGLLGRRDAARCGGKGCIFLTG